jgi:hypothetical protein
MTNSPKKFCPAWNRRHKANPPVNVMPAQAGIQDSNTGFPFARE